MEMNAQVLGTALPLDKFWHWLVVHCDCIVRAGTRDSWLYDQDDLHWHLRDEPGQRIVQLMRGKDILGEMAIASGGVVYVEMLPSAESEGQFEFQLFGSADREMHATYHFVLAHAYEDEASHQAKH